MQKMTKKWPKTIYKNEIKILAQNFFIFQQSEEEQSKWPGPQQQQTVVAVRRQKCPATATTSCAAARGILLLHVLIWSDLINFLIGHRMDISHRDISHRSPPDYHFFVRKMNKQINNINWFSQNPTPGRRIWPMFAKCFNWTCSIKFSECQKIGHNFFFAILIFFEKLRRCHALKGRCLSAMRWNAIFSWCPMPTFSW